MPNPTPSRDLYAELIEYTGKDKALVEARCNYADFEMAWEWVTAPAPGYNILEYYRNSDFNIFALTKYQKELQGNGIHTWFGRMIKSLGVKTMLDLGGGIGEYTIIAEQNGAKSTFCEVRYSKTLDYAGWRFGKHKVDPAIVFEEFEVNRDFDLVVAMDIFEHLKEPEKLIKKIASHTKYLLCNPNEINYSICYPQHISKFSLDHYFVNVDLYLWRKR